MRTPVKFYVPVEQDGWTLWDFLKAQGVSSGYIRKVKRMQPGITLLGEHKNTSQRVRAGDVYALPVLTEEDTRVKGQRMPLKIVYESEHALVLEKPAGMAVHPTLGYADGTLANAAVALFESRGEKMSFRPINRLDVGTTGLVLAAKSSLAAPFLSRTVTKEYTALVTGALSAEENTIEAPIARCEGSIIKRCVSPQGKASATRYRVLAVGNGASLVQCVPLTGRTHQIRVHFASIGHALAGDGLYGTPHALLSRHALHCSALAFEEPDGRVTTLRSPLPEDMRCFAAAHGITDTFCNFL